MNVKQDAAGLQEMLELSDGEREVPVIVEGGQVSIGFGGS